MHQFALWIAFTSGQTNMRWNPIDHMNAARANKPASGGRSYARMARRITAEQIGNDNAMFCYQLKRGWQVDRKAILDDYRRAVYPERYEEFI